VKNNVERETTNINNEKIIAVVFAPLSEPAMKQNMPANIGSHISKSGNVI